MEIWELTVAEHDAIFNELFDAGNLAAGPKPASLSAFEFKEKMARGKWVKAEDAYFHAGFNALEKTDKQREKTRAEYCAARKAREDAETESKVRWARRQDVLVAYAESHFLQWIEKGLIQVRTDSEMRVTFQQHGNIVQRAYIAGCPVPQRVLAEFSASTITYWDECIEKQKKVV